MKKTVRTISSVAATVAFAAAGISSASAADVAPHIIGGTSTTSPNVVQLLFAQNGGTYGCTGEAISAEWVLTARHCTDGVTSMNVYYSNSTSDRGPAYEANGLYGSPYGDVALVHLKSSHPVNSYATLASGYTTRAGDSGAVFGYGARANSAPSPGLYTANVSVLGASTDAFGGAAVHVQGVDGAANHGDSGGPLVIDGVIVGVCSTGDEADPGSNTQASSNYANLTASRSWIKSTSGI